MRIGLVVKVIPAKKIGFIRCEGLKQDVFFHFSRLRDYGPRPVREGDWVEFEIDELARIENQPLRAIQVCRPRRSLAKRLSSHETPELYARHHPRALRRRPAWRKRGGQDQIDLEED